MKNRLFKRAAALFMAGALTLGGLPASSLVTLAAEGTPIEKPVLQLAEAPEKGGAPGQVTAEGYVSESKVDFKGKEGKALTASVLEGTAPTITMDEGHKAFVGKYNFENDAEGKGQFDISGRTPFLVTFWTKLNKDAAAVDAQNGYSIVGKMNQQYGIQAVKSAEAGKDYIQLYAMADSEGDGGDKWKPNGKSEDTDLTKWTYVAVMYDGDKFWLSVDQDGTDVALKNINNGSYVASGITLLPSTASIFTIGYNTDKSSIVYPGLIADLKMYRMEQALTEKPALEEAAANTYATETLQNDTNLILSTDVSVKSPYSVETTWKEKDVEGAVETFEAGKTYEMTTVLTAEEGYIFTEENKPTTITVGEDSVTPASVVIDGTGKTMTITCEFKMESEKYAVSADYVGGVDLGIGLKVVVKTPEETEVTEVEPNTQVTFKATAKEDEYTFGGWYEDVDGTKKVQDADSLEYQTTITKPTTLYAKYIPKDGKIGVVAKPVEGDEEKGKVTLTKGEDPITSGTVVDKGATVTLKAEAEEGGRFVQWLDVNGNMVTRDASLEITANEQVKEGDSYAQAAYWDEQLAAGTLSTQDDNDTWFYQVREGQTWSNLGTDVFNAEYVNERKGETDRAGQKEGVWMSDGKDTAGNYYYASIGRTTLVPCLTTNGGEDKGIAYAWKAPKAGNVRVSFAKNFKMNSSTAVTLKVLKGSATQDSGEALKTKTLDATEIDTSDFTVETTVAAGDYLRISLDDVVNDIWCVEPVITYVEPENVVAYYAQFKEAAKNPVNVARGKSSTMVEGAVAKGYSLSGLTDGENTAHVDIGPYTGDSNVPDNSKEIKTVLQLDLGKVYDNIERMTLTRYHSDSSTTRTYKATAIVVAESLAEDGSMVEPVVIYNSDTTRDVYGFGTGTEKLYVEGSEDAPNGQKEIAVPENISARYVGIYMIGHTLASDQEPQIRNSNHIIEFEVFVDSDTTALQAKIEEAKASLEEYKKTPEQYSETALAALDQKIKDAEAAIQAQVKEPTQDDPSIVVLSESEKEQWISDLQKALDKVRKVTDKYVQTEYWDEEVEKGTMAQQDESDIWYYQVKDRDETVGTGGWFNIDEKYFHENEKILNHDQDTNGNWLSDGNKTYDDFYYAAISRTKITSCLSDPDPNKVNTSKYVAIAYAWKAPKDGYVRMYLDATERPKLRLGAKGENKDQPKGDIPFGFTKQSGGEEKEIVAKKTLPAAEFEGIDKAPYSVVIDVKTGDYLRFVAYNADNDLKDLDPVVEYVEFDKTFAQEYLDEHPALDETDDTYTWASMKDFNTKRKALEDALKGEDVEALQKAYEDLKEAYEALEEYKETTVLTITPEAATLTKVGQTLELTVTSSNADEEIAYTWASADAAKVAVTAKADDPAKATVEAKAVAEGVEITVTGTKKDGEFDRTVTAKATVSVVLPSVSLNVNTVNLDGVGATKELTATVTPAGEGYTYEWKSADTAKVTVAANADDASKATITAVAETEEAVDITVTAKKEGEADLTAVCKVTVKKAETVLPFDDIPTNWDVDIKGMVTYLYEKGLMKGYTNEPNKFGSNDKIIRGDFALVLYRMYCMETGETEKTIQNDGPVAETKFSDVAKNAHYAYAVNWASENKIVTGYTSGEKAGCFDPMAYINRQQVAVMLYRYAKFRDAKLVEDVNEKALDGYKDKNLIQPYEDNSGMQAMQWAVSVGIIKGMDKETLNPAGSAVRAQAATMFYRYLHKDEWNTNAAD